jgi:cAMP phosphodiesterase
LCQTNCNMIMFRQILVVVLLNLIPCTMFAQAKPAFTVVPLGVKGGADESNLSAYMVAANGSKDYVCLDAGTLRAGIEKAVVNKVFSIPAEQVLKQYIKGYFISHSHLDHLAGLIINSPDDNEKHIYALEDCIHTFQSNYFTWKSWANFADAGEKPALNKYHYQVAIPGAEFPIANTPLSAQVYPLSHSNLISTAFLLRNQQDYLLYLGDTGADEIEKSHNLQQLWHVVAPLIKAKKLKAIMIEVSFPNEQPDKSLFGHLTPRLLMKEMKVLNKLAGNLKGLNVIVTHMKPPQAAMDKIKLQLITENKLQLNLVFPAQGKAIVL